MKLADAMVQEFLHESGVTKKLLERLPDDKLSWKPHEKSMSLGLLATHIAEMPEWGKVIVEQEFFDMAGADFKPRSLPSRARILEALQKSVEGFQKALGGRADDFLFKPWQLKEGNQVLLELPRAVAIRSFVLSHSIHHRGQLSVFLRLLDIPVPAIYGSSADEQG